MLARKVTKHPHHIAEREKPRWSFYGHHIVPSPCGRYKLHISIQPSQRPKVQDKLHDLLHKALDNNLISLYKVYKDTHSFSKQGRRQLHGPFVIYLNDNYDDDYLEKIARLCNEIENILSGVTPGDTSNHTVCDLPLTPHLIFRQAFFDVDINKKRYIAAFEDQYTKQLHDEGIVSTPYTTLKRLSFQLRKEQLAKLCEEKTENTSMQAAARQLLAVAQTGNIDDFSDDELYLFSCAINLIEATLKNPSPNGTEYNELLRFLTTGKFQEPILNILANSIPHNIFNAAKENLMTCITQHEQKENSAGSVMIQSARLLLTEMDNSKGARSEKLALFSSMLNQAKQCIEDPSHENTKKFYGLTSALINKYPSTRSPLQNNNPPKQKKRSCSGIVIGAAVAFCGALVIAASVYVAAVTFFSASPISVAGVKLGLSLIATGAAIATPVAAASVSVGGLFGLRTLRKGLRIMYAATHKEEAPIPYTMTPHPIVEAAGNFSRSLKK